MQATARVSPSSHKAGTKAATELDRYLAEAEAYVSLEAQWDRAGIPKKQRDAACKQAFGYGRPAAEQRRRVAAFLRSHTITAADLGDVDPSKLRLLSVRAALPTKRADLIALIQELCSATMTQAAERTRESDDVTPRGVLSVAIGKDQRGVNVAIALERKRGQLFTHVAGAWATAKELCAFLAGAAVFSGSVDVLVDDPSAELLDGLRGLLTAKCKVRINPAAKLAVGDLRARWPRCKASSMDPLLRRAVTHLGSVLGCEARGAGTPALAPVAGR